MSASSWARGGQEYGRLACSRTRAARGDSMVIGQFSKRELGLIV
jgi:hypothetical protein